MFDDMRTIEASWQDIEAMNQSLHAAANAEEWQKVVERAAMRHQRLIAHFEHFPVSPKYAEFYQHRLTEMLKGEQSLHTLAVDARRHIMRESASATHSHRALNAYLS